MKPVIKVTSDWLDPAAHYAWVNNCLVGAYQSRNQAYSAAYRAAVHGWAGR